MLCKIRDALQILVFSIHNKILQKRATEIYKVSKRFLPPLITELFEPRNEHPHNPRYVSQFNKSSVNTVYHSLRASFFFLSGFSFTGTDNSQDSSRREGTIFYSTLPVPLAHEHSDIYLQLCM